MHRHCERKAAVVDFLRFKQKRLVIRILKGGRGCEVWTDLIPQMRVVRVLVRVH